MRESGVEIEGKRENIEGVSGVESDGKGEDIEGVRE